MEHCKLGTNRNVVNLHMRTSILGMCTCCHQPFDMNKRFFCRHILETLMDKWYLQQEETLQQQQWYDSRKREREAMHPHLIPRNLTAATMIWHDILYFMWWERERAFHRYLIASAHAWPTIPQMKLEGWCMVEFPWPTNQRRRSQTAILSASWWHQRVAAMLTSYHAIFVVAVALQNLHADQGSSPNLHQGILFFSEYSPSTKANKNEIKHADPFSTWHSKHQVEILRPLCKRDLLKREIHLKKIKILHRPFTWIHGVYNLCVWF